MILKAIEGARDYKEELSPYYKLFNSENDKWIFNLVTIPRKQREQFKDFYKPGFNTGNWNNIKVPANCRPGYDFPIYINIRYPWTNIENPRVPRRQLSIIQGFYRHEFRFLRMD